MQKGELFDILIISQEVFKHLVKNKLKVEFKRSNEIYQQNLELMLTKEKIQILTSSNGRQ